mmetsp:Transcript_15026/g.21519  ORF Transcript_15026/g.21519 Transcript_15026/m.21519 type:complete len:107 (-) Transcript_15026:170-490(-)
MARSAGCGGGEWRGSNVGPGEDLVALTVSLLQSTISHAQHTMMTGGAGDLPLPDLVDAALSAVGSMFGAHIPSYPKMTSPQDVMMHAQLRAIYSLATQAVTLSSPR